MYGIIRPSDVSPQDVEIFYTFQEDNNAIPDNPVFLDSSNVLQKIDHPNEAGRIIGGMYTLKLPSDLFNVKGIYNFLIRPREIEVRILDCGVLSARPDIRGVIFDLATIDPENATLFENGNLKGYRIEYYNTDSNSEEKKLQNLYRIITSNFRVEPVSENLTSTSQKAVRYRLNDNSNLVFCTLTPSTAPSAKPNAVPYIGVPNQRVILTNTFVDPTSITIKLVEHDFETLALGIFGNQTLNVKNGLRTVYNENNEIYKQFDEYVIKDDVTEESLYEVKEERDDINFDENFDNITN